MIPDWNTPAYPTTLFTQGKFTPEGDTLAHLQNRGVSVEHTPIKAVNGNGESIHSVSLQDGRNMPLQGLYVAPTVTRLAAYYHAEFASKRNTNGHHSERR